MKKLIASLAVAAALLTTGTACAEAAWNWVKVTDSDALDMDFYVDPSRITYSPSTDIAKTWVKGNKRNEQLYSLYQYSINFSTYRITEGTRRYDYTPTGHTEATLANKWSDIVPGTVGEDIANYVAAQIDRDGQRAAYEKEQKDKQDSEEREKNVKKGVNLLRGAFGL